MQSIVTLTLIRQGLVRDNVVVSPHFPFLIQHSCIPIMMDGCVVLVPPKKMIVVAVVVGIVVVGRSTRKSVAQDP